MKNLADIIENFILSELLQEREASLLVQRNELAERLSCAPSQISYVLSTRFTPERGYVVESRRGSGGFVRIMRRLPQAQAAPEPNAEELVEQLAQRRVLTRREQALMQYFLGIISADEEKKKAVLSQALASLTQAED